MFFKGKLVNYEIIIEGEGDSMNRIIMHIDVNSAYLSWTAVKLIEEGYELDIRNVPSVISGNPDNRQGIILAKSIPAKKYNIATGESLYEAKKKCPDILVFPPDYDHYLSCSEAMYEILKEYSSKIERYSVDECFLDYTESIKYLGDPIVVAEQLRIRIKTELGFTVNIGVGMNKLCAKMAGELRKPDLVHTLLNEDEVRQKLWPLPVEELFMVGRATAKKLKKINITSIGDLATAEVVMLESLLKSHGNVVWNYANGRDNSPVVPNDQVLQKGFGNSMTLKYDVNDLEEIRNYLLALTDRVSGRLRRQSCKTSLVYIKIKTSNFNRYGHQVKLNFYTDDTTTIYNYACRLLDEAWGGESIRQIGIGVSQLSRERTQQLSLFGEEDNIETEAFNKVVDDIRSKYGQLAVFRGSFVNTDMKPLEGGVNDGNYLMMGGHKQ